MLNNNTYNKDRAIILCNKFIAGDDQAFADLYNLFAKELYAYGMFLSNNKRLTEDALHDVFMTIFTNRKLLSNVQNVKYYFNSAFRYRLFYLMKKECNKCDIEENNIYNIPETKNFDDMLIEYEEMNEREVLVKKILRTLNEHQREVIYMRFVEGQSLNDIACLLNINYQSVKNIIQRSLKKIKSSEIITFFIVTTILQIINL